MHTTITQNQTTHTWCKKMAIKTLTPEEKEYFKKIIPVLIEKIEEVEKEFPFEKTIAMQLTVNGLRIRVKPKKFLPKEEWKKYARKYGWSTWGFKFDDESIKAPNGFLSAMFSSLLQEIGTDIYDVKKEHLEKILEALNQA